MNLKYGVVGTGALGGFYGGILAHAGKEVNFLFNSDFEHVRQHGLKVDSVMGDFHLKNVRAFGKAEQMPACDVVLVCLKTTNNNLLKQILPSVVHPESLVVLIQNGMNVEADVQQQFPDLNIAGGLAFICSNKIGPGHIAHLDYGRLIIGGYRVSNELVLKQVVTDFLLAGIPAELSPDLQMARWRKLVWNIPFNGLTVVLNATTDHLMNNPETKELAYQMMLEVIAAANASGYAIPETFADEMMNLTRHMKPYAPSMKLDFDFRRPMEIEYIYSKTIEEAAKAGFEMSRVSMLEKQLQFIQTRYCQA